MRWLALIATVLVAGTLTAPSARAQSDTDRVAVQIVNEILNGDGQLDPCRYTTEDLQAVLGDLPADARQYFNDVSAAIRAAIAARARGDCDPDAGGTGTPGAAASPSPAATPTPPPAAGGTPVPTKTVIPEPPGPDAQLAYVPATAPPVEDAGPIGRPGNDAPTPLLLLGLLAVLSLAGLAAVKGGARVGVTEGPLAPVRHAWREAAWRVGGGWETFRDWVRLGR